VESDYNGLLFVDFWIEREWQELGEWRKVKNGACDNGFNGFKVGYFG